MPGHKRHHFCLLNAVLCLITGVVRLDDALAFLRLTYWIFTNESGVQQDDVRPQNRCDRLQKLRVLGEAHHPVTLLVDVMKAVSGVIFTC